MWHTINVVMWGSRIMEMGSALYSPLDVRHRDVTPTGGLVNIKLKKKKKKEKRREKEEGRGEDLWNLGKNPRSAGEKCTGPCALPSQSQKPPNQKQSQVFLLHVMWMERMCSMVPWGYRGGATFVLTGRKCLTACAAADVEFC